MSAVGLRSAEEIALELVPEPVSGGDGWTNYIVHGEHCIEQLGWSERDMAEEDRDSLRSVFVDVINEARAVGAAAALVGQRSRATAHNWPYDGEFAIDAARVTAACRSASLGQQPRDLAGRIRALIRQKAGEWADTGDDGMLEAIRWLRGAREEAERTGALSDAWTRTATLGGERWKHVRQAADELDVIVRECVPEPEQ